MVQSGGLVAKASIRHIEDHGFESHSDYYLYLSIINRMPKSPVKHTHHIARVIHPSPRAIKSAMDEVNGFNAKFAVLITRLVGSMWCAYVFAIIAFLGLPQALKPTGEGIIAWIAQTFLQLVLLSVIMVGQSVQAAATDSRAEQEFTDVQEILDRLDIKTTGGIEDLSKQIDELKALIKPS